MRAILVCGTAGLLLAGVAFGRGPSTPEERAKVVAMVRSLETDPLSRTAKKDRGWLVTWLVEVPDITVKMCAELIPGLHDSKSKRQTELAIQPMFSAAAFVIEHPEEAGNDKAQYLAGIEGLLRVYEVILRQEPKSRVPQLDDLLAKREAGELAGVVEAALPKCK